MVQVTKTTGKQQRFSRRKLIRSLRRAGASRKDISTILARIQAELYSGISTQEIFDLAYRMLRRKAHVAAARYSLKNAIIQMGPTGFPFERLVGAILENQGYRVEIDQVVEGACVTHEVDVVARSDSRQIFVECKYHNRPTYACDVKVALYVQARAIDVLKRQNPDTHNEFHLYTNTRFTADALQYAQCVGLFVRGWDYPAGDGLKEMIEKNHLHPLTCLTKLSQSQKKKLLERGVVLANELLEKPEYLEQLGMRDREISHVYEEISELSIP